MDFSKSQKSQAAMHETELHLSDYLQIVKNRWLEISLTFVVCFVSAAVLTYLMPPRYTSTACIEIKAPSSELTIFNDGGNTFQQIGASMPTNFEIIRSPETLKIAAQQLNLPALWAMDENTAVNILRQIVQAEPRKGTELVDISVTYKDPLEAKKLAEAVTEAYRARRESEDNAVIDKALKKIDEEIQKQADEVERKRLLINSFVKEQGYINPFASRGDGTTTDLVDQDFRNAKLKAIDMEAEEMRLTSQIVNLQAMKDEQLIIYAAAVDLPDNTVKRLYPEYQSKAKDIETVKAGGLGDQHPRIKAMKLDLDNTVKLINEGIVNLRFTLETNLNNTKKAREDWRKVVAEKEAKLKIWTIRNQEFLKAQEDYNTEKIRLDNMKNKAYIERVKLQMPRRIIVYHERPQESGNSAVSRMGINLAAGAVIGLVLGFALAFFLEYMDTTIKSLSDVEKFLDLPVLGVIPKDVKLLHKLSGSSADAEAYRILRTNIEFARKQEDLNSIVFVSAGPGEGKSTTLCNLAYVCATAGYSTLMIDADMRRPRLHSYFDMENYVGLSNYLTTNLSLEEVVVQTATENLFLMSAGQTPLDASGLLNSHRMTELLAHVKERFDLVFVDSPPVLGVSDAPVLASEVDMTIIVMQPRRLPRQMVIREKQILTSVDANVLGVVLNNVDINTDHQYQYYTSYYTYYSDPEQSAARKKAKSAATTTQTKFSESIAKNTEAGSSSEAQKEQDLY